MMKSIHKIEIVDEERVDGVYIRKGYKVVEYVKHEFGARILRLSDGSFNKKAKKF